MLHIDKLHRYSVILASQSPRRREILQRIPGFKFTQVTSPFDEATLDKHSFKSVQAFVTTSACRKAQALLKTLSPPGGDGGGGGDYGGGGDDGGVSGAASEAAEPLVIAADTVVVQGQDILEKPKTDVENLAFLKQLSGSASHSVDEAVLQQYVDTGEGRDKAGGYGIQGMGGCLVDKIDGDYYNVMGLPLAALCERLDAFVTDAGAGVAPPGSAQAE